MRRMRYEYLHEIASRLKPNKIIEIGVAKGVNAFGMCANSDRPEYWGYDVFETKHGDDEWHHMVGNGKEVHAEDVIRERLEPVTPNVNLVKGMTQDTLWNEPNSADLVFIDGDHRVEAIRGDFEAVKEGSRVIVFDDYYIDGKHSEYEIDKFGCNQIVEDLEGYVITPPTQKITHVRLAMWSPEPEMREWLKQVVENV